MSDPESGGSAVEATATPVPAALRLAQARVLVEMSDLDEAELEVAEILDAHPTDLDALTLYAKIKHMRGELSQAIGCWAQIQLLAAHRQSAQLQLKSILHVAMDPERGAGEFLALGQLQLARKPAAHLELEEAFSRFLQRRPDEAMARCAELARRHRRSDRDTYKLMVLAGAWIAELSGELATACRLLEDLGQERGFETDIDRVLALERLYERVGTPDKLEAAVHICHHIDKHFHRLSMLARLSALYRRLGKHDLAADYEGRYLIAFRRRYHRPTLAEVVQVAGQRYLPLQKLAVLRLAATELPDKTTERERAVAAAIGGDRDAAREAFTASGTILDRKYLADLTALAGDRELAEALYVAALREDPHDLRVIKWILQRRTEIGATAAIATLLRDPPVAEAVRAVIDGALRAAPFRPSLWRLLASLLALDPVTRDQAQRATERAEALEAARRRDASPVGRVLAAAAYHFVGKVKGLIHEVWAGRHVVSGEEGGVLPAANILGNLSPELRQAIQNVFLSVREYARSKFPHLTGDILDFTYTFKMTKEDEPSYGLSAGLPTALALLSVFLQWPVPQDIAATGMLVADAHDVLTVRPVGDTEHKVKGAYNRNLRAIILPLGNRAELSANPFVPPAVQAEIVRYAASFDDAVKLVFGPDVFIADGRPRGDATLLP